MVLRQPLAHINSVSSTYTRTFIFVLLSSSPHESVSVNDQPAGSMCQASCISYAFITTASTNLAETL